MREEGREQKENEKRRLLHDSLGIERLKSGLS
jgi:hypothetical protein